MNISRLSGTCVTVILAALFCTQTAAAKNKFANPRPYYQPISIYEGPGNYRGIWLVDAQNPTDPMIQITSMPLDGSTVAVNSAIFATWKYDTGKQEAVRVAPRFMVYGQGGHLYSENLKTPRPPRQFSSGSYTQLCYLGALDGQSYRKATSYLVARVIPSGSGDCATGVGTQTWLIPVSANKHTPPIIEPNGWNVLGAFATLSDGSFQGWLVNSGSSIELDDAGFNFQSTLITGLTPNDRVSVIASHGTILFVLVSSTSGSTITDTVYRVTASGASTVGSYNYAINSVCVLLQGGSAVIDAGNDFLAFAEPTNSGYSIYHANIDSGGATSLYDDASGTECGALSSEDVSAGHVIVNDYSSTDGGTRIIGIAENGPPDQVPVVLAAGDANTSLFAYYIINGHVWITDYQVSDSGSLLYSVLVRDGDGTSVATYTGSQIAKDIWGGFHLGDNPLIDRLVVYLFTPTDTDSCSGGTLVAIDPATFSQTPISGLPSDACSLTAFGWNPTSFGDVSQPGGDSIIAIDPNAAQLYVLSIPQSLGSYIIMSYLPGYPFY
ncbi:MAG TPA: hypothetical protein VFM15_02325 [Gammaproteobacteria bacterium]|nr:hypothetical protein [Gammaproteobacteria bacterium]